MMTSDSVAATSSKAEIRSRTPRVRARTAPFVQNRRSVATLIIPAARGVQLAGDWADEIPQTSLDPGMDVLVSDREGESAGHDFVPDPPEPVLDDGSVLPGDDSRLPEHASVGDRAPDILADQPHVEPDRGVERFEAGVRRHREAIPPHAFAAPPDSSPIDPLADRSLMVS